MKDKIPLSWHSPVAKEETRTGALSHEIYAFEAWARCKLTRILIQYNRAQDHCHHFNTDQTEPKRSLRAPWLQQNQRQSCVNQRDLPECLARSLSNASKPLVSANRSTKPPVNPAL